MQTQHLEKENMHNKKGLKKKKDIFWTFGKKLIEFKKSVFPILGYMR